MERRDHRGQGEGATGRSVRLIPFPEGSLGCLGRFETKSRPQRVGLLEVAEGGTAFLDEVDKLSVRGQSRLLRAIEAKRIRPLGTNREKRLDVRFLAASNRSLPELVRKGEFLSDLYYRISDILLPIPPLRTRPEDVAFLFERFLAGERECLGKEIPRLGEGAWSLLEGHPWTGNVRELRQVARRLAIFCDGRIEERDVREALGGGDGWEGSSPPAGLREKVRTVEMDLIGEALRRSEGNLSRAARALGLSPQALHYKVRRLRVGPGEGGGARTERKRG